MLDVQIAVAKTNKYATRESGDTVEVVERPHGGFSVVLADGQGSGRAAKTLSHLVTTKAVSMIKDGARDGVVARSVHDYLFAYRGGKVSATLVILTVDLASRTLVLSRNSHCPVILSRSGEPAPGLLDAESTPIGIYAQTKPVITEIPLEAHTFAVTYSDGLMDAGKRDGHPIDLLTLVAGYLTQGPTTALALADYLLQQALDLDANRPYDDMTALVLAILPSPPSDTTRINPQVRRMDIHIPL
ncbi:MAG: PP2C family protein-serine/threonine phosphatase [Chloroflexia bacterium]